jgi:hypothetical protein
MKSGKKVKKLNVTIANLKDEIDRLIRVNSSLEDINDKQVEKCSDYRVKNELLQVDLNNLISVSKSFLRSRSENALRLKQSIDMLLEDKRNQQNEETAKFWKILHHMYSMYTNDC